MTRSNSTPRGGGDSAAATPALAVPGAPTAAVSAARDTRGEILYFALRSKKVLISTSILVFFILLAIFGPMIDSNDPGAYLGPLMQPPTKEYWFGTTMFGQDVFAQFVNGLRATFVVGLLGGSLAALIGMVVGFTGGYLGGWVDEILNVLTNVILVIPTLAVLIVLSAYLKARGVVFEAVFIGFFSWPWAARAIRAQTFSLRSRDYVDLARLSGRPGWKVIFLEIAPNMSSYLFMTFILLFGGAILIGATLDFIGLGPTSGWSLGLMMFNAVSWAALQLGLWWWFIPPGIGITAVVASLYVMDVGLDEIFNPRLREM
jgi:peptide/nickel transport system permease protein